jgi:hypothetical protein
MRSMNPEDDLTPVEVDNLDQLEAIVRPGRDTYTEVGDALAEIRDRHLYRDSHPTFEAYVRERWGVDVPDGSSLSHTAASDTPCEALAKACEETLSALDHDDRAAIDIRLAVRKHGEPGASEPGQTWDPWEVADAIGEDLLATLRWLLTQAGGTIGRVAHQLEHRAAEIDDSAREQLRDDVMVVDDELATVKALLIQLNDWDAELERLMNGELPPFETDTDSEYDN